MRRLLPLFLLLGLLLPACGVQPTPTPIPAPQAGPGMSQPARLGQGSTASRMAGVEAPATTVRGAEPSGGLPSPEAASARLQAGMGIPDGWGVLLDEDFQDPDPEVWGTGEIEGGSIQFGDRELVVSADKGWLISSFPATAEELTDGYVSASFRVEGSGSAGVMARFGATEDDSTMYVCWIEGPRFYACYKRVSGYWAKLIEAESFEDRTRAENTLVLQIVGDNLLFGINGQPVASFVDGELASGAWGVFAQSGEGAATAHFTHVLIARPAPGQPTATSGRPQPTVTPGGSAQLVGIDPSFGTGGRVTIEFGSTLDEARAVVVQPDGKIVVAGEAWPQQSPRFTLARLFADGSLDRSFGDKGKVITNITGGQYDYSGSRALAMQSDGKFVAAGYTRDPETGDPAFALARYHNDGRLDSSFGKGGRVITRVATGSADTTDEAYALAIQPDGRIVVAGQTAYFPTDFAVVRYMPDGKLDNSFGKAGKAIVDFGYIDRARAVAIQPDGKIVAAGSGAAQGESTEDQDFALLRLNKDGSLDRSFGKAGKVTTNLSGYFDEATSIVLRPDGKIVLGGMAVNGAMFCQSASGTCWRYGMALAQYNADGSQDLRFGTEGEVIVPELRSAGYGMVRLGNGTLALGGFRGDTDFGLGLFTAAGQPVPGFGERGVLNSSFGQRKDQILALALQPDGRIVAVGSAVVDPNDILNADFALMRYK